MVVSPLGSFHASVLRLLCAWVLWQMFFWSSAFELAPGGDLASTVGKTRRMQTQAWKYQVPCSECGAWQAMMDALKGASHWFCLVKKQTLVTSS